MLAAIVAASCGFSIARAQPSGISRGEQTAWSIVDDVVRIETTSASGSAEGEGFGLVVGQKGETIYVITADHVVRKDQDDSMPGDPVPVPGKVQVIFHNDQGHRYAAEPLDLQITHPEGDLAVLALPRPRSFKFDPPPMADADILVAGTRAWRIGKLKHWVPSSNPGQFVDRGAIWMTFDELDAPKGSSGGPVVNEDGVVGIIVSDVGSGGDASSVLPIGTIAGVLHGWQVPWDLRPRPQVPDAKPPSADAHPASAGGETPPATAVDARSAAADAELGLNLGDGDRRAVQHALNQLGFPAGNEDGQLGEQSRTAIRDYQARSGFPVTGFLDALVEARLTYDANHAPPASGSSPAAAADGLKDFAATYFTGASRPDALDYLRSITGDRLDFYGRTLTREQFIAQQASYVRRWPEHIYTVRRDTVEAACDPSRRCSIKGVMDYRVRNIEKGTSSSGAERFALQVERTADDLYRIVGQSGVIISREPAAAPVEHTGYPARAPASTISPKWTSRSAAECGSHFYTWQATGGTFVFTDQSNQTDVERVVAHDAAGAQTETVSSGHQEIPGTRWSYSYEPDGRVRVRNIQTGKGFTLTRCPP